MIRSGRPDDRRQLRRPDRVSLSPEDNRRRSAKVYAGPSVERHRAGRPLCRHDVRQGAGRRGPCATTDDFGAMFKDARLPRASGELCWRAGLVMNYGDGIYGGMFVSGMYAAAFFENDPRKVVEAGLATIPARS